MSKFKYILIAATVVGAVIAFNWSNIDRLMRVKSLFDAD